MDLQVVTHTNDEEHVKPALERLVELGVTSKLKGYLDKFDKEDAK